LKKQEAKHWASMLADKSHIEAESVPAGWRTTDEIAREMNRSISHVRRKLNQLAESGLVEVRKFRIRTGERAYPVDHFKDING